MRRWVAALFLVLAAFYLGASIQDRCAEGPSDCGQVCHILCNDGCATAPIPEPPIPPPHDPLPGRSFEAERVEHVVCLEPEPEKDPPRA